MSSRSLAPPPCASRCPLLSPSHCSGGQQRTPRSTPTHCPACPPASHRRKMGAPRGSPHFAPLLPASHRLPPPRTLRRSQRAGCTPPSASVLGSPSLHGGRRLLPSALHGIPLFPPYGHPTMGEQRQGRRWAPPPRLPWRCSPIVRCPFPPLSILPASHMPKS